MQEKNHETNQWRKKMKQIQEEIHEKLSGKKNQKKIK